MAKKPTDPDLFKKLRENFLQMTDGFVDIGQRQMAAQAAIPAPSDLWKRLRAAIQNLVAALFRGLDTFITHLDPVGKAQAIGGLVGGAVEGLLDAANQLISDIQSGLENAGQTAISMVLGLIEAVKKSIYLVLDGLKVPQLSHPVEVLLDLINNLIGNMAELISPEAGKAARTFRNDMYGQLYAIRRADAARSGRVRREDPVED